MTSRKHSIGRSGLWKTVEGLVALPNLPPPTPCSLTSCNRTFETNTGRFKALPTKAWIALFSQGPKRVALFPGGSSLACGRGKLKMWRASCISEHSNFSVLGSVLGTLLGSLLESIILKAAENRLWEGKESKNNTITVHWPQQLNGSF